MPGQGQLDAGPVRAHQAVGDGHELLGHLLRGDEGVQPLQHGAGGGLEHRVGAQRGAQLAHHDRRRGALAHHVAERDDGRPVREPDHVVPVAADLRVEPAGPRVRTEHQAGHVGQGPLHQAALELLGGGVLTLVGDPLAEGLGDLGREGAQQPPLLDRELLRLVEAEQQTPDPVGLGGQAEGDQAAGAQLVLPGREPGIARVQLGRAGDEHVVPVADDLDQRHVREGVDQAPAHAGRGENVVVGRHELQLPTAGVVESQAGAVHTRQLERGQECRPGDLVGGVRVRE